MPFDPKRFDDVALQPNGIRAAFGVPDTNISGLLTFFCATKPVSKHIVTANEGAAVALAAGYHLSTGNIAMVYMQNSGLANALSPLQSIAAKEVFGIPMLLLIGWRGKSAEEEELQDAAVGPRLLSHLKTNDIPYEEVPTCIYSAKDAVARLLARSVQEKTPVALIAARDTFAEYEVDEPPEFASSIRISDPAMTEWISRPQSHLPLSRKDTIRCIIGQMTAEDVSISSLGGNTREYYMLCKEMKRSWARNFFCLGAMGHVYALSYGVSMGFLSGRIFCIDGDGSFVMHAGNNALLAGTSPSNLAHIVIYNGVHASTGNHPMAIRRENLVALVRGLPYEQKFFVDDAEGLENACKFARRSTLIIVAVNRSLQKNLPAPSESPYELKDVFMTSLRENKR
ncbi:hypothetical protein E4U42_003632 [Claviceps africana]|uniref:Phosphonopyruvate decarboxylase n=1 Tax=Claviceps africana TaxID=83212 RepID=A0A8K0NP94_9HYPO|nr:hypothetical protein E4U42_003632 [Claviceps africana]